MPILNKPTARQRFSHPIGPSSHQNPTAFAAEVVTDITPNATSGNTVEDHLNDLIARSGHGQASQYATGTNYAVGAEVYWVDSQNTTHFYIRLTAGQDAPNSTPNNLTDVWREVINNLSSIPVDGDITTSPALLEMEQGSKAVRASTDLYARIGTGRTAAQVQSDIESWIDRVCNNSRWRGEWATGTTYRIGDYAEESDTIYRRLTAGSDNSGEDPAANSTDWMVITGVELRAATRLKTITEIRDYEEYRGAWADLAAGTVLNEGDIVKDDQEGFFITKTTHTKTSQAPETDGGRFSLVTVYRGTWSDRDYHSGSVVVRNNMLFMAHTDVDEGDEAPDDPATTKWHQISSNIRYRGDWASIPFQNTVFEGDILYHDITRRSHGNATEYATEVNYSIGDEVYWDDASMVRHYYIRQSAGADTAGTTPDTLPAVWHEVFERAVYLCKQTHFRTSNGPDTDPARFDLLSNYLDEWEDAWYQEGSLVKYQGRFYLAGEDVSPGDPAPNHQTNEKWLASGVSSGTVTPEYGSRTIGYEDNRSFLRSPGHDTVWSGPGLRLVGTDGELVTQEFKGTWRGNTAWTNSEDGDYRWIWPPKTVADGLVPFFDWAPSANASIVSGYKVKANVPGINTLIARAEFTSTAINRYTPEVSVGFQRGNEVEILGSFRPVIPADTSGTNLYTIAETIDLSDITLKKGDRIGMSMWFRANETEIGSGGGRTVSQETALSWFHSLQLDFFLDGTPIPVDDLDTAPVQARPMRSWYCYDPSLATGITYKAPVVHLDNDNPRNYAPFFSATGEANGNGWILKHDKTRGYFGRSSSEPVCDEAGGTNLGFKYTATVELHDQTNDPANPDEVRFDLMRTSRTGNGIDFTSDTELVTGGSKVFDIRQFRGTVTTSISTDSPNEITYTLPADLQSIMRVETGLTGQTGIDESLRAANAQYIGNTISSRRYRLIIKPRMLITSLPGPARLQLWAKDVANPIWEWDIDTHLSTQSPTEGAPANIGTNLVAYDSSTQRQGIDQYLRDYWFRIVKRSGANGTVDYGAMTLTIEHEINRSTQGHLEVTLNAPNVTMAENDRVYVAMRTTTSTTNNRGVTVKDQQLQVWNVDDVTGREVNATGNIGDPTDDNPEEHPLHFDALSAESAWWASIAGELVARKPMRQVSWVMTAPAITTDTAPHIRVWRQVRGVDTRELLSELILHSSSGTATVSGVETAWLENEEFTITSTAPITGEFVLELRAQAPQDVPKRIVHTEGMLRNRLVGEFTLPQNNNWKAVELLNTEDWHFADQNVATVAVEIPNAGRWDVHTFNTELFALLTPLQTTRLGQAWSTNDPTLQFYIATVGKYLFVSPVEDGQIALAIEDNANGAARQIRVFLE